MTGPAQPPGDRTIPVPDVLALPETHRSPLLVVLDHRLRLAAGGAPASTEVGLRAAHFHLQAGAAAEEHHGLFDDLSDYLFPHSRTFDPGLAFDKAIREYRVTSLIRTEIGTVERLAAADLFELLLEIHRRYGAGPSQVRRGAMFTRAEMGSAVEFPPAHLCVPLLGSLQAFIATNLRTYPTLCAAAALVGVVHAHPFPDGNGRSARTLFNIIMSIGCGSDHFLPIPLLAEHSRGGFILKQRRALYGGEWAPIMEFLVDAFRLSAQLQAQPGSGEPDGPGHKPGIARC